MGKVSHTITEERRGQWLWLCW